MNAIETRAWDVRPGDIFRGHVVTAVDVDPAGRSGRRVTVHYSTSSKAVMPLNFMVTVQRNGTSALWD